jgi:Cu+-exporting ATPase
MFVSMSTASIPLARASCLHCGDACGSDAVVSPDGTFCCRGCESVYGILKAHHLEAYYTGDVSPGVSQKRAGATDRARFAALDDPGVSARLVEFDDGRRARVTFRIPSIHCASCVWLLEQLWRFDPGVARAEVDLLRRSVQIDYRPAETTLRRLAEQVAALGYEPEITSEGPTGISSASRQRLYLQLGVAGFAFGNIMLFSIPRYANGVPLEGGFQRLFDVLNVLFALPVLLFSAADYFRTAWHALRNRTMALEVPVALGLAVLFGRSLLEIVTGTGEGFLDSFAGLTFFLLIGRLFQQKAFDRIAFDRTFRSFLPLSIQVERERGLEIVPIEQLRPGDCVVLRRHEVVPADAVVLDRAGEIDYAFATGEQTPVSLSAGEIVRAGGRAAGEAMRLQILRDVSHSQLAGLWSNPVFSKPKARWLTDVTARFGGWFTVGAIVLAICGAAAWWPDGAASASVATAVLIVACPCALTLSAPITLGTAMGVLGGRGLYLKHPAVALDLSRINTVAFDKTGTLTTAGGPAVVEREGLSPPAWDLVRSLANESVHPVSRAIAASGGHSPDAAPHGETAPNTQPPAGPSRPLIHREVAGHGLSGSVHGVRVVIGTAAFVAGETGRMVSGPVDVTYVAVGPESGWLRLSASSRPGIEEAARALSNEHDIWLVSGDHSGERARWEQFFGRQMRFRQSPEDKLAYIEEARARGRRVLMVGDGLNDAGALAAADVGMAVSDDTSCMAPACDAVISGHRLTHLPAFLRYARRARQVVVACFLISIAYNVIGLTLALAGALTPLASAILMPVSSLTVVGISSGAMRWSARRMLPA